MAYFVGISGTIAFFREGARTHWETAIWLTSLAVILYVDFAFFREQMCLVVCPYGRLQSLLVDNHTVTIGYDEKRGEPRRQKGETVKRGAALENKGDCIDCGQCVNVCPTGIDIRNGMQLDCIACTACIDACDVVMTKMTPQRGSYATTHSPASRANQKSTPPATLCVQRDFGGSRRRHCVRQSIAD